MKAVHTFKIRSYECDLNDHLNHANYLRLIHEAFINELEIQNLRLNQADKTRLAWILSDINIDYSRPYLKKDIAYLKFHNLSINPTLILSDFTFSNEEGDKKHARGSTAFSVIDKSNFEITTIPTYLRNNGFQSSSFWSPKKDKFKTLSPKPEGAYSQDTRAQWRDITGDQILLSAALLDYLVDFLRDAAAACGWSFYKHINEGFTWFIRREWLNIIKPVTLDDRLRFTTWISDVKRSVVTRNFTLQRLEPLELIGQARMLWVCVNISNGKLIQISENFVKDFESQIYFESY
jgi:acyl-CoA thioesterase FadM